MLRSLNLHVQTFVLFYLCDLVAVWRDAGSEPNFSMSLMKATLCFSPSGRNPRSDSSFTWNNPPPAMRWEIQAARETSGCTDRELAEVCVVGVQADTVELLLHTETLKHEAQHLVTSTETRACCCGLGGVLTMLARSVQAVCRSRRCRQENT